MVTGIDEEGVRVGDERISARTVLWAAGVAASPLGRALEGPLDRAGRVRVEPDLTLPEHPDVYVAGDLAAVVHRDGKLVPGLAPAAIQEGRHVARNMVRSLRGEPRLPFHYFDKGSLATIGRIRGVGVVFGRHLRGALAWLAWLFVHIFFLIGFRNRVLVILEWAWQYLTFRRGARLITDTAEQWQLVAADRAAAGRSDGARWAGTGGQGERPGADVAAVHEQPRAQH
jgi:NADH dehydrogenase